MMHLRSNDAARIHVDRLLADARAASGQSARRVQLLAEGAGYKLRQIFLMTGEELPFRRNPLFSKVWHVAAGRGHADIAEADVAVTCGATIEIGPGALHQIENRGASPLVLLELRVDARLDDAGYEEARGALAAQARASGI